MTNDEHWQSLKDLIALVEPLPLRRALLSWINKNVNCAYSVKSGSCTMQCESEAYCPYDVTLTTPSIRHLKDGINKLNVTKDNNLLKDTSTDTTKEIDYDYPLY